MKCKCIKLVDLLDVESYSIISQEINSGSEFYVTILDEGFYVLSNQHGVDLQFSSKHFFERLFNIKLYLYKNKIFH